MEKKVWEWYSREKVQKALLEVSKNREVVCVFKDGKFGKRPDMLQYPQDIIQAVRDGAIAFHGSVERWDQPMKLKVGLTKEELDSMRTGWDVLIDVDVSDFEIAKIVVKRFIEALRDHGILTISCKYTGGNSFHLAIPFESLPLKVNMVKTSLLYPDLFHKILAYLKWYSEEQLKEDLIQYFNPIEISERVGLPLKEVIGTDGKIQPFKFIVIDMFGSRHLFRLPYSLHEKTKLVSLPIKPEKLEKFRKEDAEPERVRVEEKFLSVKPSWNEAEGLVVEALDWASKHEVKIEEKPIKVKKRVTKLRAIPETYFPPCIKRILEGLNDGRKRSIFILTTFLRNMGWENDKIEKKMYEWNEKNVPPLRANYIRTQLRWHFRQERNLLPPNCDNPTFYLDMKVCNPDDTCLSRGSQIKNPINYPFKKLRRKK